jgi:hypothetical protein
METYDLSAWDDFRPIVKKIRAKYGSHKRTEVAPATKNVVLFRGHANSEWPLKTTLERWTDERLSVIQYMVYPDRCSNELESLTGRKWEIPTRPELEKQIQCAQDPLRVYLPCYDYLVYLRQHGFPSPLLDWTTSPYIAAYFAYFERPISDRVAIYAYIETPTGGKSRSSDAPQIKSMGPFVSTHNRHFAQKAWYTIATKYHSDSKEHFFCSHTEIMLMSREDYSLLKDQDILIKITLPSTERLTALEELNDYNINHFTLFQTEDALIKALAIREFELRTT